VTVTNIEGAPVNDRRVSFAGDTFSIADRIGLMPLMKFAHAASSGVDSSDMEGLAAMYDLLRSCLADEEWPRFEAAAMRSRAVEDELLKVISDVMEKVTAHPSQPPSDSSDGRLPTGQSSPAGSFSVVIGQVEPPDEADASPIQKDPRVQELRSVG